MTTTPFDRALESGVPVILEAPPARDLFDKCRRYGPMVEAMRRTGVYERFYRPVVEGALDHAVEVRTGPGTSRRLSCFDSNSYLHLHRHPRVVAAVRGGLDEVGYGTPSAQLLCGTSRYLCELEETVAAFHGRPAALVFSSGYAANLGTIGALLGPEDALLVDRHSHASIHDGGRAGRSAGRRAYAHRDVAELEASLAALESERRGGVLIATDGLFSMHGTVAPLPELARLARRYRARLLVDEAHATGVLGPTGRGLEDHFGLPGAVDVLVGTFSKAPGTIGGYVVGDEELIEYLRFHARSAVFTAALPAALCAGVTEAFRVMEREPEHRERLWQNVARFARDLRELGLPVLPEPTPIFMLPVGAEDALPSVAGSLFAAGIKAGYVTHPVVPRGEAAVRLSVTARHTAEELDRAAEALAIALRGLRAEGSAA